MEIIVSVNLQTAKPLAFWHLPSLPVFKYYWLHWSAMDSILKINYHHH